MKLNLEVNEVKKAIENYLEDVKQLDFTIDLSKWEFKLKILDQLGYQMDSVTLDEEELSVLWDYF